jgi:PHAX RNA-binding domain
MEMVPEPKMMPQSAPIQEQDPRVNEIALILAQTLGETEQEAQEQLQRIVWALGGTQCYQLLEQTLQIEHDGGMMLRDGSRRRTPGGFFSIWH